MGRALLLASLGFAILLPLPQAGAQPPAAAEPAASPGFGPTPLTTTPLPLTTGPTPVTTSPLPPLASELQLEPEYRWYGWQTLLADGAIVALSFLVEPAVFLAFPFATAGIHLLHRNFIEAAVSGGARLFGAALFFAGFLMQWNNAFSNTDPSCTGDCPNNELGPDGTPLVTLAFVVWAAAIVTDAALATRRIEPPPTKAGLNLQPWLVPQPSAGGLSLAGRF